MDTQHNQKKEEIDDKHEQSNSHTANIEDKLLLDTGSTIRATVMNADFITNIRMSDKPTMMQTNAGAKLLKLDGDLKGFGIAKYDPSHMANIMGFSHMADRYHVTYDNKKEDAFVVRDTEKNTEVKFRRDGRLYTYAPSKNYLDAVAASKGMQPKDGKTFLEAIMTKEGNRDGYTDAQYNRAKRAWKLYINTGGGGLDNFKHYLRQNIIHNCPVTNDDINRAQKIFVHDVGHLKGSTTRKTPEGFREQRVEIPQELIHQSDDFTLFVDLFYVNGMPMLTTIDAPVSCLLYTSPSPRD